MELRPHLYRLVLGRYQAYLWHDNDSTTLIDTGEAGSGPMIAAALDQIGLAPDDLDRVILTHFHDDHTGSAHEISSWGDVQIVAHASDATVIRGDRPGPPPNFTDWELELHARVAAGLTAAVAGHLPVPQTNIPTSGSMLSAPSLSTRTKRHLCPSRSMSSASASHCRSASSRCDGVSSCSDASAGRPASRARSEENGGRGAGRASSDTRRTLRPGSPDCGDRPLLAQRPPGSATSAGNPLMCARRPIAGHGVRGAVTTPRPSASRWPRSPAGSSCGPGNIATGPGSAAENRTRPGPPRKLSRPARCTRSSVRDRGRHQPGPPGLDRQRRLHPRGGHLPGHPRQL